MNARPPVVTRVADGVHAVAGSDVNWLMLVDGEDVTLLDTGYPGDRTNVPAALQRIGRRVEDVRAILLTHAHVDHLGNVAAVAGRSGATVYAHPAELAQVRGEVQHQVSPLAIARQAWRPGVLPWALRAARNGGLTHPSWPTPVPLPVDGTALDVPGGPVPVPTPGHTPGSCCFLLPEVGVVATGDSLITGHPTSGREGPQLIGAMFQDDSGEAAASLDALQGLSADILVPGHGPVYRGAIAGAVALARG
ncbi:MAG: MBL fold metallo-hydrolase [Jatrophihabitans sp.]|uniref:MBL fold metallo-hydrolase n=1 Tax=Jatrophihabitans sp. TaxID=1932789 RepID=UPI003F8239EC